MSSSMGGKEPCMRARLGSGWQAVEGGSHDAGVVPSCADIFLLVLLGLHACCSSQGDGGVVILTHVTSDKRLCWLAFDGLRPVCPALSTLALEKAREHLCAGWEQVFLLVVCWWWNSKDKVLSLWCSVKPNQPWGTQNFLVTEKLEVGPCHPSWERKRKAAEIAVDRVTPTVLLHFTLPYWDLTQKAAGHPQPALCRIRADLVLSWSPSCRASSTVLWARWQLHGGE